MSYPPVIVTVPDPVEPEELFENVDGQLVVHVAGDGEKIDYETATIQVVHLRSGYVAKTYGPGEWRDYRGGGDGSTPGA